MKFEITYGQIIKPQKVVIYGPEGIGKTTFAAQFPNPLFIDTEGSSNIYDVARLPSPTSWVMLMEEIREVVKNPSICDTLVIDTLDWAETLCVEHVCAKAGKKGIEDFGYGNGYVYVKEEFGRFLNSLSDVIDAGINVVLTAHMQMRKFEQPDEAGSYDRYELKLGKKTSSQTAPLVKEWSDILLFANYKTIVMAQNKEGTKNKAAGGKRVMYTTHHPNWDAKNRHDLAEELPFDYKSIEACISTHKVPKVSLEESKPETVVKEAPETEPVATVKEEKPKDLPKENKKQETPISAVVPKALADLMAPNSVTLDELQNIVTQKGYYPAGTPFNNYDKDFVDGCLIGAWDQVLDAILSARIPF